MRTAVTILAILIGVLVVVAVWQRAQTQRPAPAPTGQVEPAERDADPEVPLGEPEADGEPAADATPAAPAPDAADVDAAPAPDAADVDAAPAAADATAAEPAPDLPPLPDLEVLAPESVEDPLHTLGEADPDSPYRMRVRLTAWGAAVGRITLANYAEQVRGEEPYEILDPATAGGYTVYPFAARRITINDQAIDLQGKAWTLVETTETEAGASATYRLTIAAAGGQPVLDVIRRYELPVDSYDLKLHQHVVNRSGRPLVVAWDQYGQGDLPRDPGAYLGDQRMIVMGYFPPWDPNRTQVWTTDAFLHRANVLERHLNAPQEWLWPYPGLPQTAELVWLAAENRYFAVVTHPVVEPTTDQLANLTPLEQTFERIDAVVFPDRGLAPNLSDDQRAIVFRFATEPRELAPGGRLDLSHAIFAGPRRSDLFEQPPYALLGFEQLVRYNLGGMCAICTFQWLAHGLLAFLEGIHWVVRDWGVAIIILVLVVRLLLHPLTKRAQVNMMKMGKQMQMLQPEIEKLRKKYKDDQARLNQEMMKLYREKGVNPANMLGCLPMFLQTPIWIALYAMLYFAIELRHEPAFYGVFQAVGDLIGVYWPFLADLSSPDQFIPVFDQPRQINLIFIHPNFQAINILPILMAVVFYFQQKLTMPPPANEQGAAQQRMMRFVILLFPIFLYSAPSGLTLYILASTFAGIIDSYIVRKHVREQEEAGTLFEKKPPKPGSFRDRIAKAVERKQQELQRQLEQQQAGGQRGGQRKKRKR